ncbi:MAG: DUF721 domain-containing protein [Candidatus Kapabacteria bacterium]|nr:DUF721 domain-containing protein [Candidatus Kapabacteria bacterium]
MAKYTYSGISIGDYLKDVAKIAGFEDELVLKELKVIWADHAGELVIKHAKLKKFIHGKLIVEVKSSTWHAELLLRKDKLIADLNAKYGKSVVKDIVFS